MTNARPANGGVAATLAGKVPAAFVPATDKGIAGGVATLDASGKLTPTQMPTLAIEQLWLAGDAGRGSSNTSVRRLTTIQVNTGTSMTLTQSAVNGDSILINKDGIYSITYVFGQVQNTGREFGITKNSSQLTTAIENSSFTSASILTMATAIGVSGVREGIDSCSWTGSLITGDVVRIQSTLGDRNGTTDRTALRMARVR